MKNQEDLCPIEQPPKTEKKGAGRNGGKREEALRTLKYALCIASAGAIQFGVTALMTEVAGIKGNLYWISYLVGLILSVIWNFTLNRRFTFKSAANVPKAMLWVFVYYLVFTPISTFGGDALVDQAGWPELVVTIMFMLINGVTEFLWQRFFVFRNSINTNAAALKKLAEKEET